MQKSKTGRNRVPRTERCSLVRREQVAEGIFRVTLACSSLAEGVAAGNFLNIRVCDLCLPLWRRPFSYHDVRPERGEVDILFNVTGRGTRLLSEASEGTTFDVLGPLGNAFPEPPAGVVAVMIAGGLGIAPFLLLARQLAVRGNRMILLYGARTRNQLIGLHDFEKLGVEIHLATDDGSAGLRGTVVDLFRRVQGDLPTGSWLYTCGPLASVASLGQAAAGGPWRIWASLETAMACGFGACMGCAVKARNRDGYYLVCKDGPVFDLNEVVL